MCEMCVVFSEERLKTPCRSRLRLIADMASVLDEQDCVVREIEVHLCSEKIGANLCLLSHPLRPPWRPYDYGDVKTLRMKPQAMRVEVDVPLNTHKNYNNEDTGPDGAQGYKQIEHVTLRSQQVEQNAVLAMGVLYQGKLLLSPLDMNLQMRPNLAHLNVVKKGGAGDDDDEEEEEEAAQGIKAVEVQVQKRETERQVQARLNSYAYMASKEAEEPWKNLNVHLAETPVANLVWDHLLALHNDKSPHQPLSRDEYIKAFGTVTSNPLSTMGGQGVEGAQQEPVQEPVQYTTLDQLTDACRAGFATRMQALFAKHSVVSLENVRQWLLDPRYATSEVQKAAAAAAKDAALLEDKSLHELVLATELPLVAIRRMYVLKQTGKPETDEFRQVVVDMLLEKEGFKKNEITEAANKKGVVVTDSLYIKVLKDLCVNRAHSWMLKNGADV